MKRLIKLTLPIWITLALVAPTSALGRPAAVSPADTAAPAVPGQFIVKFKPGTPGHERTAAIQAHGGRFFDRIADLDIDAVEFPALKGPANPRAAEALMSALTRNPNVEYVEPNYIYSVNFTPNDPNQSWQYAWRTIQAYAAWDVTRGSSNIVIAIVDTGIQRTHPDLDAKIVAGYDYVDSDTAPDDGHGHGTHVAGTAAAETDNNTGGAGMCPNCKLMPVRVMDNNGFGNLVNVAAGITFAANNGARVINLSVGGSASATLQNAVNNAWNAGAFLACSASNDNTSNTANAFPAPYDNCFAVASTTSDDARSWFSNFGNWVEVAAPGSSIYSAWLNSGYGTSSGTSMATPHVAGLAGLLASQGLTNAQIRDRICNTATQISGTGANWTCGRINAARAVGRKQAPVDFDADGRTDLAVWRGSSGDWSIIESLTGAQRFRQWGDQDYGDMLVPGDYDGDGKTDLAVWRGPSGEWYIIESSTGAVRVPQWGDQDYDDVPVPSAYVRR